jgi:poly-gamma-glutamate synthesis protein (capsule biosynthesis protein)
LKFKLILALLFVSTNTFSSELKRETRDLNYSTSCDEFNSEAIISFVGDILIHKALYQVVASESKHFSQIWQNANGLFQKADFSVGNLEGPAALGIDSRGRDHGDIGFVYDGQVYSGTNFLFNYHPRIFSDLKNSGFDLVTMANNHALDRTSVGIDKTIASAQEAGILSVGTRRSDNNGGAFHKMAVANNVRVAFLGCTEMTNGISDNDDQVLTCYKNSSRILGIIKNLSSRSDVDAVIVMPHWGTEYTNTPNGEQKMFARRYIDAGALAVVGSHPHVLQPWEKYISPDGREALILYSLGNFVAGQAGVARRTGPVAYLGLSKNGNQKAAVFGVGYTPTFRVGARLFPVGKNDYPEVLKHVATMYGTKARVEPSGSLKSVMCQ